ncbi:MAG: thymidine kinase [Candidatus Micrarchaeaceae archaeon]
MKNKGRLIVITGPMFSGKTTKLIKDLNRLKKTRRVVIFKSTIDNRYSGSDVVSHEGLKVPALLLPKGEEGIAALKQAAANYDVIGIDEAHFWGDTEGFAQALNELAFESKTVYVSMLSRSSDDGTALEIAKDIIPLADRIYLLNSKCSMCSKKASFTKRITPYRLVDGKPSYVGGAEDYEIRCRECFSRKSR